jgi:hypothetical protein
MPPCTFPPKFENEGIINSVYVVSELATVFIEKIFWIEMLNIVLKIAKFEYKL